MMNEEQKEYFERYNEKKIHHFLNKKGTPFTANTISKETNISRRDTNYALKSLHIKRLITKKKVKKKNTVISLWTINRSDLMDETDKKIVAYMKKLKVPTPTKVIALKLNLSFGCANKHLNWLRLNGIVTRKRDGNNFLWELIKKQWK